MGLCLLFFFFDGQETVHWSVYLFFFFMVTRVCVTTKDHCSATSVEKSPDTLISSLHHEIRNFQISPNFATTNPFREGSRGGGLAIRSEGRAIPGFGARVDSELIWFFEFWSNGP